MDSSPPGPFRVNAFDEWLTDIFGQDESTFWFETYFDHYRGVLEDDEILEYLSHLFANPAKLDPFTPLQAGMGLSALSGESGFGLVRERAIAFRDRLRFVESVVDYYQVLVPYVLRRSNGNDDKIESAIGMLWDASPFHPGVSDSLLDGLFNRRASDFEGGFPDPDTAHRLMISDPMIRALDLRLIGVLGPILLESDCETTMFSILHGFGHGVTGPPNSDTVKQIRSWIKRFLNRSGLDAKIRDYAAHAWSGVVL